MYSQPNQDIKNLRYTLSVTHVRDNHANFQKFWPIDKVRSKFTVESKNALHNKISQLEKYVTLEFQL